MQNVEGSLYERTWEDIVVDPEKRLKDLEAKLAVAVEALKNYRETLCEGFCKDDDWADEGHSHPDNQFDCGGCLAASVLINCAALAQINTQGERK